MGLMKHTVSAFLNLISLVVSDGRQRRSSTEVIRLSLEVLGDLVLFFQAQFCQHIREAAWLHDLFLLAQETRNETVLQNLQMLQKTMAKYAGGSAGVAPPQMAVPHGGDSGMGGPQGDSGMMQ